MKKNSKNVKSIIDKLYKKSSKQAIRGRKEGTMNHVVYKSNKVRQKPPEVYNHTIGHDFLQYLRLVTRWAVKNHDISRREIEFLHYLHPIGLFTRQEFNFFCKCVSISNKGFFKKFLQDGWIVEWRKAKPHFRQVALFKMGDKGKKLCKDMHLMCIGEKKIPEGKNNAMTKSELTIDKYYLDIIKRVNRNKKGEDR